MSLVIYHNPRCSKSRETLALLQDRGLTPQIIDYLKTPPDAATLREIVARLGLPARALVRKKEAADAGIPDTLEGDALLEALAAAPAALERPVVVCGDKARIGRPPAQVLEIL